MTDLRAIALGFTLGSAPLWALALAGMAAFVITSFAVAVVLVGLYLLPAGRRDPIG